MRRYLKIKVGLEDTAQLQSICLQCVREGSTPATQEKKNHHLHNRVATIRASGNPISEIKQNLPQEDVQGPPWQPAPCSQGLQEDSD